MRLITSIDREISLLPFFISHYRCWGIQQILAIVFHGDNPPWIELLRRIEDATEGYFSIGAIAHEPYNPGLLARMELELCQQHVSLSEWHLRADLDEMLVGNDSLPQVIERAERNSSGIVISRMIDRVAEEGQLVDMDWKQSLDERYPWAGHFTARCLGGCTRKCTLLQGHAPLQWGGHDPEGPDRLTSSDWELHHFKWNATIIPRLLQRAREYRELGYYWWVESQRFLEHVEQFGGIDLQNEAFDFRSTPAANVSHPPDSRVVALLEEWRQSIQT